MQSSLLLAVSCTMAGAGAGLLMFRLARRDARTVLPGTWRPWMAGISGALCGMLAWVAGPVWELPALLLLALFGVLLAAIDLRTKLLPNALVLPFAVAALALLVPAAALSGEWDRLVGAALGSAAMFVLYLVLALISPSSLGIGDVKLAAVLGLYGGYAGAPALLVTAVGGFILGGAVGIVLLLFANASRKTAFPFGPPMLAATLAAVVGWA